MGWFLFCDRLRSFALLIRVKIVGIFVLFERKKGSVSKLGLLSFGW